MSKIRLECPRCGSDITKNNHCRCYNDWDYTYLTPIETEEPDERKMEPEKVSCKTCLRPRLPSQLDAEGDCAWCAYVLEGVLESIHNAEVYGDTIMNPISRRRA